MIVNKSDKEEKIYNIGDFTKKIDYKLETANERINLLNSILYTEKGYPIQYFEDLFDQDARIKATALSKKGEKQDKTRRVNLFPTTKQPLSHDIYECKQLEHMASYILTSQDQPRMDKQQEYNFYDEDGFKRLLKKEKLYEDMVSKISDNEDNNLEADEIIDMIGDVNSVCAKVHFSKDRIKKLKYIDQNQKMAFLKRTDENYKLAGCYNIYKRDLKDPELKYIADCQVQIEKIQKKVKNGELKGKRYIVNSIIRSLRDTQIAYKNYKKGTIIFKNPLKDSGMIDYDEVDFFNKEHVLALINMPKKQIADDNDLAIVLYDLEVLMRNIKVREEDGDIIALYRNGLSQEEIANEIGVTKQSVNQVLSKLADNVIQEYERIYEDWYYLNKVKGKYKKCSKCGEIKLHSKFSKHAQKKDGLRPNCKQCDND